MRRPATLGPLSVYFITSTVGSVLSRASLVAQLVKNPPARQETSRVDPWVGQIPCRMDRLPSPVFMGFPGGSVGEESTCNARDLR